MPDIEGDNSYSAFCISELQYKSTENSFVIDLGLLEQWVIFKSSLSSVYEKKSIEEIMLHKTKMS